MKKIYMIICIILFAFLVGCEFDKEKQEGSKVALHAIEENEKDYPLEDFRHALYHPYEKEADIGGPDGKTTEVFHFIDVHKERNDSYLVTFTKNFGMNVVVDGKKQSKTSVWVFQVKEDGTTKLLVEENRDELKNEE